MKNRLLKIIILFWLTYLLNIPNTNAQIFINSTPYSKIYKIENKDIPEFSYSPLAKTEIDKIDSTDQNKQLLPRFGYGIKSDINILKDSKLTILPNGDKIYRLSIRTKGASSVSIKFDKFQINDKGRLYVHGDNYDFQYGAYTSLNNKGTTQDMKGMMILLITSNEFIIEYNEPKEFNSNSILHICELIYNYVDMNNKKTNEKEDVPYFTEAISSICNININCPLGDNWQDEKKGVALVFSGGIRWGSGTLINNTV